MHDLYNSKFELGVEDTPYNRHYFSVATEPFERKVYLEKLAPPGKKDRFMNAAEGVSRARKGLFAFIAEETVTYKLMEDTYFEHEKCGLVNTTHKMFLMKIPTHSLTDQRRVHKIF